MNRRNFFGRLLGIFSVAPLAKWLCRQAPMEDDMLLDPPIIMSKDMNYEFSFKPVSAEYANGSVLVADSTAPACCRWVATGPNKDYVTKDYVQLQQHIAEHAALERHARVMRIGRLR